MRKIDYYISLFFIFSILFCFPFISYGQTALPSTINSDYTLIESNSPYRANYDVTVNSGVKLTVEPGVVIEFVENAGLYVKGRLVMEGEANNWIYLKTAPGNSDWDVVTLENTSGTSTLRYVEITGCSHGKDSDRDRAALNAANVAEVILENVRIFNVASCIYYHTTNDRCSFKNCYFKCDERGSVFFLVRSDALIQDCEFAGVVGRNSDAIDFDRVTADIIGNTIYGMTGDDCDGIDMGSESVVYLKDNLIMDCTDSGIEAEEKSNIVAENNIIFNCNIGITVKENAIGTFSNNTFYNNDICFTAYSETNTNGNGGSITAINNIIAETGTNFTTRNGSSFMFRYNLTQSGSLSGVGNIIGDAQFVNPGSRNFNLQSNSPAIDSGDPNSPVDPDGTRADIGALFFEQDKQTGIVISEIHYNPIIDGAQDDEEEFIELLNISDTDIDIGNYFLSGAVQLTFPAGATIEGGERILVVANPDKYAGFSGKLYSWTTGNLGNSGDLIYLKNPEGRIIIEITYSTLNPWPLQTKLSNLSFELRDPDSDMEEPQNWRYSLVDGGTPGAPNVRDLLSGIFVNELVSKYGTLYPDELGNYSDWIEVYNANSFPVYLNGLYISDDFQDQQAFYFERDNPDDLRVAPNGFLVLFADANSNLGSRHLNFQLLSSGEEVMIGQMRDNVYSIIDQIEFGPLARDQSYGRNPDGSANFQIFDSPTPGAPNEIGSIDNYFDLKINELVAKYDNSYPDEHGLFSDWIEIYNSGQESVNLAGVYLSDRTSEPKRHRIPVDIGDSATIQPGGYLVLRPDAKPKLGYNHLSFELSSGGEDVVLSVEVNGKLETIDHKEYPSQVQGKSYGRLGDGGKWWAIFGSPSPGESNATTSVRLIEEEQLEFLIYPNPTADKLTILISGKASDIELVEVFDMKGEKRKIWNKEDLNLSLRLELNTHLDTTPPGVYFIRLVGSSKSITRRFIIQ